MQLKYPFWVCVLCLYWSNTSTICSGVRQHIQTNIRHKRQNGFSNCMPTSVSMVLESHGHPRPLVKNLKKGMDRQSAFGMNVEQAQASLRQAGIHSTVYDQVNDDLLSKSLKNGTPFIVGVKTKIPFIHHAVIVEMVDQHTALITDPAKRKSKAVKLISTENLKKKSTDALHIERPQESPDIPTQ